MELAIGALAVLVGRGRGATGARRAEVSLVEASVAALVGVLGNHLATGEEPGRWGSAHPNIAPYQAFAARDGHLVVAVGNDAQFRRLLGVLNLTGDERFATNPDRVAHRAELGPWLAAAIGARERDELLAALAAADVPAGPVNRVSEALAAMRLAHPGGWTQAADGMELPPDPIRVDGERLPLRTTPPLLGEHTSAVLAGVGYSPDEIEGLRETGVVR
jgi:crotonobetainyl-CoA:carnitine CoA-transferase CaiB-like acyl-CoA transferase